MTKPRVYWESEEAFWHRLNQQPPYMWLWMKDAQGKIGKVKMLNPRFDLASMSVVGQVYVEPRYQCRVSNY